MVCTKSCKYNIRSDEYPSFFILILQGMRRCSNLVHYLQALLNVNCEVIVAVSSRVALPITCPDFAGILLDLVKCWPVPISNY
jgi:hypothetical protein